MAQVEPATTDLSVSLVEHTNFAVSDRAGDMLPGTYHGFFVSDTRVLSRLVLRVNGRRLEPLASADDGKHSAGTFYLANPRARGVPPATISVFRDRVVSRQLRERIRLIGYGGSPTTVELTIELDADFADIFEVRGRRRMRRTITRRHAGREIDFGYTRGTFAARTRVRLDRDHVMRDGRAVFDVTLEHGRPWDLRLSVEAEAIAPPTDNGPRRPQAGTQPRRIEPARVRRWLERTPELVTEDPRLARAWRRGVRDMAALLLTGPAGRFIPAAGLPWYLAIFGRDSAITAMQTMVLGPEIPLGTLRQLSRYQGTVEDPWREEEPGKIPHEVRGGELSTLGHIPFGRYYGSVDATPLYVMLYAATCRWSGLLGGHADGPDGGAVPDALAELLPPVEAALGWIERRTARDGMLWYAPARPGGIRNQVWKDSHDSMRRADGSTADPPIAAVEVQGYVVRARLGMADVYEALGRHEDASAQRDAAARLAAQIEDLFWIADEGTYALGIDADGRQVDGIGSNAGHLLWTDVVRRDRAASVAERLMAPDLFTGWGIRTLSSRNPGYNPIGYHVGAVWPHDTSLIASGLARVGQTDAALRLIDALLDACVADPNARLPELFAGFDRSATPDLVPYPTACSPQAWATGAVFLSVRTLLDIDADARPERWRDIGLSPRDEAMWPLRGLAGAAPASAAARRRRRQS
jgi:glycogen debranching enzyme